LSVMAALVGALASYLYLALYYKKQNADYIERAKQSKPYDLQGLGRTYDQ
ncbi:hypothetical protein HMPREF0497_1232, partial [Lentilactobacillus buchneri ATCC 11577]